MNAKKVIFIGNAKSGKTAVTQTLREMDYKHSQSNLVENKRKYMATVGAEVWRVKGLESGTFYDIWDCAGNPDLLGLRDGYYIDADIVVIFSGGEKFQTVEQWKEDALRVVQTSSCYITDGNLKSKLDKILKILI